MSSDLAYPPPPLLPSKINEGRLLGEHVHEYYSTYHDIAVSQIRTHSYGPRRKKIIKFCTRRPKREVATYMGANYTENVQDRKVPWRKESKREPNKSPRQASNPTHYIFFSSSAPPHTIICRPTTMTLPRKHHRWSIQSQIE